MGCIIFPINMITETSDKVCTMEYVDKEYIGKIFCKGLEQGYTLFAPFYISLVLKLSYKILLWISRKTSKYQIKHILTLV